MAMYTKQRYRFIYSETGIGHIFDIGAEIGYCGTELVTLKKEGKLSTTMRWRENRQLCEFCQAQLKASLGETYDIQGWA